MKNLLTYDIETYPDIFTFVGKHEPTNTWLCFELSERVNQALEFINFLLACRDAGVHFVGYNNEGFDYPVIHHFMTTYPNCNHYDLYLKADKIINGNDGRFAHLVKPWHVIIPQIDLYKIHHFDNVARSTSLKTLEFNMGSEDIQDLPIKPGEPVGINRYDDLIKYNYWDVEQTSRFLSHSLEALEFRDGMSSMLDKNCTNMNDVKIGKQIFINALEKVNPGSCYDGKKPRQTPRASIALKDVVLPYVRFNHPEFNKVLDYFNSTTITETKGVFKDVSATIEGFKFDFGLGGIHGSVESQIVRSDEHFIVVDYDVASYYPNLSIANRLYPEHLGETFCDVYQQLYNERKKHPKGSLQNAALKLALNGTYGASNDKYSPFYDPKFTMGITINGQLLLCMLAEKLLTLPGCHMVQINTDGLTIRLPRHLSNDANNVVTAWEALTGLSMERVDYSAMYIRDVNNYIAEGVDGKVKRKGCYGYGKDLGWHQNHSGQVIAKVAERVLLHDEHPLQLLMNHQEPKDFLICTKVPRSSKLLHGDAEVQNISRYIVSKEGAPLTKLMPPLKDKTEWRRIGINIGFNVKIWNNLEGYNLHGVDYSYYYNEVKKITEGLMMHKPTPSAYMYYIVLSKWVELVDSGESHKAAKLYPWVSKWREIL